MENVGTDGTGSGGVGRLRRSALAEIALLLGVLLAVDALFLDGGRFAGVSPHPFWVVVLLVAVQYGSREGILAAAASTAALLLFHWPEQRIDQELYDHLFGALKLPLLWFAGAVLFGEIRMRHVSERDDLRRELDETHTQAEALARAYERLRSVKEALETRVASQLQTTTRMYRAAQAIDKLHPEEVLSGVTDVVRTVLSPEKFSLHVLREGVLEAVIQDGWSSEDRFATRFDATSVLFQEVMGRQRVLCASGPGDERVLGHQGVLAGPLLRPESGDVVGMLKIEKLGFLRLSAETLGNFRIVCDWIATAYGKAVRFQEAERERVIDAETELYSHSFLDRQTDYVSVLARRIGFDLSLVTIRLENEDTLDEAERERVPQLVRETVGTVLRRTDLAFRLSESATEFAILLPGTSTEKARIVIEKLRRGFREQAEETPTNARFGFDARKVHEHERPSLFQEGLFPRQTEFLSLLASRFGFAITMVVVRATNGEELVDDDRELLPGAINLFVSRLLSPDAPAFTYQRPNWEFPVVLPSTTVGEAQEIGERLVALVTDYVRSRRSRAQLAFTVQALSHARPFVPEPDVLHA